MVFHVPNMISWTRKGSFIYTAMRSDLFSYLWMIMFIESCFLATHFSAIKVSLENISDKQSKCSDYLFIIDCYFVIESFLLHFGDNQKRFLFLEQ